MAQDLLRQNLPPTHNLTDAATVMRFRELVRSQAIRSALDRSSDTVLTFALREVPWSSPVAPVDIQRRPITGADPLPPRTNAPLEISAPQQPPTAEQDKGVFSALKQIPDLLRPDPPAPTGETPRPPMPVGPASPEIK